MAQTVGYYHFLISPWSYLAIGRFNDIKAREELQVHYLPIDVGSTFELMGGVPPAKRHPSRQKLRMDELKRWSTYLDIPINLTPAHFPVDQSLAACMVYAANTKQAGMLSDAMLTAVWRHEQNLADEATLVELANNCGCNGAELLESAKQPSMKQKFMQVSADAHSKNVYGSPTYIVNGELFWGQDRLDFLERALIA